MADDRNPFDKLGIPRDIVELFFDGNELDLALARDFTNRHFRSVLSKGYHPDQHPGEVEKEFYSDASMGWTELKSASDSEFIDCIKDYISETDDALLVEAAGLIEGLQAEVADRDRRLARTQAELVRMTGRSGRADPDRIVIYEDRKGHRITLANAQTEIPLLMRKGADPDLERRLKEAEASVEDWAKSARDWERSYNNLNKLHGEEQAERERLTAALTDIETKFREYRETAEGNEKAAEKLIANFVERRTELKEQLSTAEQLLKSQEDELRKNKLLETIPDEERIQFLAYETILKLAEVTKDIVTKIGLYATVISGFDQAFDLIGTNSAIYDDWFETQTSQRYELSFGLNIGDDQATQRAAKNLRALGVKEAVDPIVERVKTASKLEDKARLYVSAVTADRDRTMALILEDPRLYDEFYRVLGDVEFRRNYETDMGNIDLAKELANQAYVLYPSTENKEKVADLKE